MSRLTEREMEEIRRVKRAVQQEAREEISKVRLAHDVHTRQAARQAPRAGLLAVAARFSGLSEVVWILRCRLLAPLRQKIEKRRAIAEMRHLSDHALRDIGVERSQIEAVVHRMHRLPSQPARPEVGPIAAVRHWLWRRRTVNTLSLLSDRILEDIGLLRAHIPDFVEALEEARRSHLPEDPTVAQVVRFMKAPLRTFKQWNLSRRAANDLARLDPEALADIGYVKGDVDWVPEVLAERKLNAA